MFRHRRGVLLAWLVLVFGADTLASQAFGRVAMGDDFPNTEAAEADRRLEELGATNPDVLGLVDGAPVSDPAIQRAVVDARERIARLDGVSRVDDYYGTGAPFLVAEDGTASIVAVHLVEGLGREEQADVLDAVGAELRAITAPRVVGGQALIDEEFTVQSERTWPRRR